MLSLNNLFERMQNLNLTSKKLSEDTGISTGNISDWKKGRSMPTANKLIVLADYLNCSIDYILGRTNNPEVNTIHKEKSIVQEEKKMIIPFFETPASAGTGTWLEDDTPVEWITIPRNEQTTAADFILSVRGDSMQPKFYDGDNVLIKKSVRILEGEIGVFILNREAYIKKMGRGELISLNPAYPPIKFKEYDDIRCAGKVLGAIDLE